MQHCFFLLCVSVCVCVRVCPGHRLVVCALGRVLCCVEDSCTFLVHCFRVLGWFQFSKRAQGWGGYMNVCEEAYELIAGILHAYLNKSYASGRRFCRRLCYLVLQQSPVYHHAHRHRLCDGETALNLRSCREPYTY